MQRAFDADARHCFVYLKQGLLLCARVSCSVHVTQILNAALCPIDRDICCTLEYSVEAHIVDLGSVGYSTGICAFALSFLVQSLCIPAVWAVGCTNSKYAHCAKGLVSR